MGQTLPTFLIVGAARSGTTSVWQYLRDHPDVFMPDEKEVNFFNEDGSFDRGLDWYAGLFAPGRGKKAIGEASPSYLASTEAAPRMAAVVPDARLVAILRNPIDRTYSHYLHGRFFAVERRSFRHAVEQELRSPGDVPWPFNYVAQSHYHEQLVRLNAYYPREQILVQLLDDLRTDPAAAFRSVCEHLGIDPTVIPASLGETKNAYRESRAQPLVRFLMRPAINRRIPKRVWPVIQRLVTREGGAPEPIDPDVRARLAEHFAPANVALGEWLGRDLSAWR